MLFSSVASSQNAFVVDRWTRRAAFSPTFVTLCPAGSCASSRRTITRGGSFLTGRPAVCSLVWLTKRRYVCFCSPSLQEIRYFSSCQPFSKLFFYRQAVFLLHSRQPQVHFTVVCFNFIFTLRRKLPNDTNALYLQNSNQSTLAIVTFNNTTLT